MNNLMEDVVKKAFRMLIEAMDENGSQKLLFPCRRNGISRYSEQEFKQMLIKALEETNGIKYSVETPTLQRYSSQNGKLIENMNGESGRIDMCIYQKVADKWQRLHLVELKAHNVKVQNDLMKLIQDSEKDEFCKESYFIQILYSANKETLSNLQQKYNSYIGEEKALLPSLDKEIIVYLLFANGVQKVEESPCYCRFNLRDGLNEQKPQKI